MSGTRNKTLRIFRLNEAGERIPYVLELDHELTVMSEYADHTAANHVAAGRSTKKAKRADTKGRRIALAIARWVTQSVEDNPIPGTDAMRDTYFEELDALHRYHAQNGSECKPCDVGVLIRQHRTKLEKDGHLAQFA